MPPRSKVEKSPHYKEIVDLLLSGQSGRTVSKYLMDTYNEDIGYGSINTFKRNHLDIEAEVKTRELTKQKQQQLREKQEEQKQEAILERAEIESDVAVAKEEAITKLAQALHVIEFFINTYGEEVVITMMNDAEVKSDSKLNLLLKAIKYYLDFYKDDKPEVNINNQTLTTSFNKDKIRSILDAKRGANTRRD